MTQQSDDRLRYIRCLRKKKLTHVEADRIVNQARNQKSQGKRKGKKRKSAQEKLESYWCRNCEGWHVGHSRYPNNTYDPAHPFREQGI